MEKYDNNGDSVQPRLWCITVETEGAPFNIFTIGVDMDDETAEYLVKLDVSSGAHGDNLDDYDLSNYGIGIITFECVPEEVDNHALLLVPIEEVKELRI